MENSEIDAEDMHNVLSQIPQMLEEAQNILPKIKLSGTIKDIFILGMGGSGFAGDLLKCYLQEQISLPIYVVKDYQLPSYADKNSLFFALSYSGNTEETISAYREATKHFTKNIIAISSGGRLKSLAEINGYHYIPIPSGLPPRLSTPYLFVPLLKVLQENGLIKRQDNFLAETVKALKNSFLEKKGQELAQKLHQKLPLIYSSSKIGCVAEKWKTDINENAKTLCFYNLFPEFNHNELNGYDNFNTPLSVVLISDVDDHPRNQKRLRIIKKLLQERKIEVTEVALTGENYLSRLFTALSLGLWTSYYLALLYQTNPTPVKIIEEFKEELGKQKN